MNIVYQKISHADQTVRKDIKRMKWVSVLILIANLIRLKFVDNAKMDTRSLAIDV